MNFWAVFKRELNSARHNIGMMIILIVGPLFLLLFFGGVYYNDYVNDIPIAVIDEDGTSLSRTVIDQFATNERFFVKAYPASRGEMKTLIDEGVVHMGLFIPEGFSSGAKSYQAAELLLFTDGTNLVVANNAYAQATSILQTLSAGVEVKLIEAKGVEGQKAYKIALPYKISERVLYDSKLTYMSYLIICFFAVFLQQLYMAGMGSTIIRHQEDLSTGNVFVNISATALALITGFIPAAVVGILIMKNLFHVPMVGDFRIVALMTILFLFVLTGPALLLASATKDRVTYSQISLMLSLPTFVSAGCVWPVEQMPALMTTMIKICWPLINYGKFMQEVIVKGRALSSLTPQITQLIMYGGVWIPIGLYVYKRTFSKEEKLLLTSE